MAQSISFRPIGSTFALSVGTAQHATVQIPAVQGDLSNYIAAYNSGTTQICMAFAPAGQAVPTLAFPVDGAPTNLPPGYLTFMLPGSMPEPLVIVVPANGFAVSAIGSAAGPSIIFLTQVASQ
jgi:hypothetical protein